MIPSVAEQTRFTPRQETVIGGGKPFASSVATSPTETDFASHQRTKAQFGLGGPPASVLVMQNDVLTRFAIDLGGETPTTLAMARNPYDTGEKALDLLTWIAATTVGPVVVDNYVSNQATAYLRQKFPQYFTQPAAHAPLTGNAFHRFAQRINQLGQDSALRVPWGWLNGDGLPHTPLGHSNLNASVTEQLVKEVGFQSKDALHQFLKNPAAKNTLLAAKLGVLTLDLGIMGIANLIGAWGKNVITEVISGKKGFSGEFNYATQGYLDKQAAEYDKNKGKRFKQSLLWTAATTLSLPAIVTAGVLSKGKTAAGRLLRKANKLLDYHQGIYTSKWLILWGGFLSWLSVYTLAARDKNERREQYTHAAVLIPTYLVGDDLVSGLGAKFLQKNNPIAQKMAAKGLNLYEKGVLGLPKAREIWDVLADVGNNSQHPVYKMAKNNAWLGLFGATLMTGLAVPLINHPTTKKTTTTEQKRDLISRFTGLLRFPISLHGKKIPAENPFNATSTKNTASNTEEFSSVTPFATMALATTRFHGSLVQ